MDKGSPLLVRVSKYFDGRHENADRAMWMDVDRRGSRFFYSAFLSSTMSYRVTIEI